MTDGFLEAIDIIKAMIFAETSGIARKDNFVEKSYISQQTALDDFELENNLSGLASLGLIERQEDYIRMTPACRFIHGEIEKNRDSSYLKDFRLSSS